MKESKKVRAKLMKKEINTNKLKKLLTQLELALPKHDKEEKLALKITSNREWNCQGYKIYKKEKSILNIKLNKLHRTLNLKVKTLYC